MAKYKNNLILYKHLLGTIPDATIAKQVGCHGATVRYWRQKFNIAPVSTGQWSNFIDLTGHKYNLWTVLKLTSEKGAKNARWLCRCDCGVEKEVSAPNLRSGGSKGCGHLNEITSKCKKSEAGCNALYSRYRWAAKKNNREFSLTKEQFKILTQGNCFYCNQIPSTKTPGNSWQEYIYNGIDRKDSNIGYVIENCLSCCSTCNYAKQDISYQEFINWIKKTYVNCQAKNLV